MDFLLSKYGLIFTEFDSIDLGSASVDNVSRLTKYSDRTLQQVTLWCDVITQECNIHIM